MAAILDSFVRFIGALTGRIGRAASFIVFFMMLITTSEVIARYVFNHPTDYAWPLNRQLFGVFILLAGSYTTRVGGHIRIEILFDRLPHRSKLIARWVGLLAAVLFLGTLTWQTAWMGLNSLEMNEKMAGAFRMPLYPFKLLIPAASFLFLCQVVAVFIRDQFGFGKDSKSD